ncbi:MAG: TetR/AcrR family transcriptional regulator [Pseudonocardiales bacterium]|nr:TetR/AcrR family transcriptional regulator [Pseudonocardiales bacterium]
MTSGYLKGRLRREDIITAAIEVYGEAGYGGSSMRAIAKRVGMTHAGLVYYFPSKQALLAAVLERRDTEDAEREHLAGPPGLDGLRRLVDLAAYNVQHRPIVDLYARLAAEAVTVGHPAHDYFERHYRDARNYTVASFTVLAERGEMRDDISPHEAAVTFIALMDGLQVQWLTTPDAVDLVGSLRGYLHGVLLVAL